MCVTNYARNLTSSLLKKWPRRTFKSHYDILELLENEKYIPRSIRKHISREKIKFKFEIEIDQKTLVQGSLQLYYQVIFKL